MSVLEMQKVQVISLKPHKEPILKQLQKIEAMDIRSVEPLAETQEYEVELAELRSAILFLEGFSGKKKTFIESFIPPKEELTEEEMEQACRETDCGELLEKCKAIEGELANLKNLIQELKADEAKLLPWSALDIPLANLACTEKTCIAAGVIKSAHFEEFRDKFNKFSTAADLMVAGKNKEETHLVLIYLSEESEAIGGFISKSELSIIDLPTSERTPAMEIAQLRSVMEKTKKELQEQHDEAIKLTRSLDRLKYFYDQLMEKRRLSEAKRKFFDLEYTFALQGWIKKQELAKVRKELLKVTDELEIFPVQPDKDEKPPVALENPPFFSPFELITNLYATPKPGEIDPSIPLSFFFALFFGICLGDFAYGIVLSLFSLYFLKKYKLPKGGVQLFNLLLMGGIVSAVVGVLTGSYLGFSPKDTPLAPLQIIDPVKDPITMLIFSLVLGVVQIFYGKFLSFFSKFNNKDYTSAFLDDALWIFFLASLVLLAVSLAVPIGMTRIAAYLSIAGAVGLTLTQGRSAPNIFAKLINGLLSLYSVSAYVGDTLSYSRLLALGMSTTIIGAVINILADMARGGVPGLGIVLMIIILIFGHLLNLVIGTLGAFVHSTRLQMVEFFGKFYEGGGRAFRPFRREAEYTVIKG